MAGKNKAHSDFDEYKGNASKKLNSKQKKVLAAIFNDPCRSDIKWKEVENLFGALGAEITNGNGSRVRIDLNDKCYSYHRPHPQPEIRAYVVKLIRTHLISAGVLP